MGIDARQDFGGPAERVVTSNTVQIPPMRAKRGQENEVVWCAVS